MTNEQKKEFALMLFLHEKGITQKEIAARAGVSEVTVSTWSKKDNWEKMRRSTLITRQKQLGRAYEQLDELNGIIEQRPEGQRFANNKEADIMVKLGAHIRTLETELSVADVVDVGINFMEYVRQNAPEKSTETVLLFDGFVKSILAK